MKQWVNKPANAAKTAFSFTSHVMGGLGAGIKTYPKTAGALGALGIAYSIAKAPLLGKKTADRALEGLYPGNMMPTQKGRFGQRTNNLRDSSLQGTRFNFRRK